MKTKKRSIVKHLFIAIIGIAILGVCFFVFFHGSKKSESSSSIKTDNIVDDSKSLSNQPSVSNVKQLKVPVFMFHYVEDSAPNTPARVDLQVSAENFKTMLSEIKSKGYTTVTLQDIYLELEGKKSLPKKSVVLTFDDGYQDAYSDVYQILKSNNMVGTFFIITNDLNKPDYLTTDELKEMAQGGMEIGSHTLTHPDLSKTDIKNVDKQLTESKSTLENIIGKDVTMFCYPSGKYNDVVVQEVKKAGYVLAVTTQSGVSEKLDNRLTIPRIRVKSSSLPTVIEKYLP